jgi:hypothetical protein
LFFPAHLDRSFFSQTINNFVKLSLPDSALCAPSSRDKLGNSIQRVNLIKAWNFCVKISFPVDAQARNRLYSRLKSDTICLLERHSLAPLPNGSTIFLADSAHKRILRNRAGEPEMTLYVAFAIG